MIQRVQSLFFFFSAICVITIIYIFPVLTDEFTGFEYFLKEYFQYPRLCLLLSAALSVFAIFQYKNRKRQQLMASFSRLMITIAFFLIVFLESKDKVFSLGAFLLIIPFLSLIAANFFINRDEKIINSADRIR